MYNLDIKLVFIKLNTAIKCKNLTEWSKLSDDYSAVAFSVVRYGGEFHGVISYH